MVRILILVVVGLLSFSIVFGLGYLFIVPHSPEMEQMEETQPQGDMTPANDDMMKSDSEKGTEEPPPPPPKTK